jgi:hypothetical protein
VTSVAERCDACGNALAPRARFCRACGAAVEATELGEEVAPASAAQPATAAKSAAAPRRQPDRPPPPPPAPPPGRRDNGPFVLLSAVLACLLVAALVAGGAFLLTRDDGKPEGRVALPSARSLGGLASGSAPARAEPAPESPSAAEEEGVGADESAEPAGRLSDLIPGRYVQAASFRTEGGAESEVELLRGRGVEAEAVPAGWTNELLPGFWVLLVGPLGPGQESRVLHRLEGAGIAGLARDLTPSRELSGPGSAAGGWHGDVERTHLRGARRPVSYPVEIHIAPEGASGTVEYPRQGCRGSLTLGEDAGYWLSYSESIERGDCPRGGLWSLRPGEEGLTATWLQSDLEIMANGDLEGP